MNNKIYDLISFVGGTALTLLGFFGTLHNSRFFYSPRTDWYDILLIIVGISMIVFGFLRRSWEKK